MQGLGGTIMTKLVYEIYNIKEMNERVIIVGSIETAKELCLVDNRYAFKPIVVATSVSEAKVLIRNGAC